MIGRLPRTTTGLADSTRQFRSPRVLALAVLAGTLALAFEPPTLGQQQGTARPPAQAPAPAPRKAAEAPPDPDAPRSLPPEMDQVPPIPVPAGGMVTPAERPPVAKTRDSEVVPADAPGGDDQANLPGAGERPDGHGKPASPSGGGGGAEPDPIMLSIDKMSQGRQRVQLSVEVQAPAVINLGKESTVKLVVGNEGAVDAHGVSVLYQLPDGLELVQSLPEATQDGINKSLYFFKKSMLPGSSEWTIVLKVKANAVKPCEHAASVTAKAGSKFNTTIQEPKLKVEATATPGRVLKGGQVTYQITVRNPGSGPARNVTVQARLSSGLKHNGDDLVEQTIDVIPPGSSETLEPLTVDTVAGGQQSCTVDVRSPDVNPVPEDARVVRTVDVTKPEILVKLSGQETRYAGQDNEYKVTVTNPGTAPAKRIKLVATMPTAGGKIKVMPKDATFDRSSRKLTWTIPQIEPGGSVQYSFIYGTSSLGLYVVTAEATAGELHSTDRFSTDVTGIAVLDLQVTQSGNKVIDVGQTTFYDITIKNVGTKEATRLQLSGDLTNMKVKAHYNVDKGEFKFSEQTGVFVFPEIDRLGPNQTLTLSIEVQPTKPGPAGAHVHLAHAEMEQGEKVEDVVATKVTGNAPRR